jgi:hypothetical protein
MDELVCFSLPSVEEKVKSVRHKNGGKVGNPLKSGGESKLKSF